MSSKSKCSFCQGVSSGSESAYLAGTWVCLPCFEGGFVAVAEEHGVRVQELQYAWRTGSNQVEAAENEVIAALAYDLGFEATFAKEGLFSKVFSNRDEIQTGDPSFDKAVLIKTGRRETTAELLEDDVVRGAIAELVPRALEGLRIEGNRCRLAAGVGSSSMPDPFEAKRLLALLFTRLSELARAKGLPRRPDLLGLPSIETLTKHFSGSGKTLELVRFSETTFDDLELLRPLVTLFRRSLSAKLELDRCTIKTSDYGPTDAIAAMPRTRVDLG